jgi:hypothetical protein
LRTRTATESGSLCVRTKKTDCVCSIGSGHNKVAHDDHDEERLVFRQAISAQQKTKKAKQENGHQLIKATCNT